MFHHFTPRTRTKHPRRQRRRLRRKFVSARWNASRRTQPGPSHFSGPASRRCRSCKWRKDIVEHITFLSTVWFDGAVLSSVLSTVRRQVRRPVTPTIQRSVRPVRRPPARGRSRRPTRRTRHPYVAGPVGIEFKAPRRQHAQSTQHGVSSRQRDFPTKHRSRRRPPCVAPHAMCVERSVSSTRWPIDGGKFNGGSIGLPQFVAVRPCHQRLHFCPKCLVGRHCG